MSGIEIAALVFSAISACESAINLFSKYKKKWIAKRKNKHQQEAKREEAEREKEEQDLEYSLNICPKCIREEYDRRHQSLGRSNRYEIGDGTLPHSLCTLCLVLM